MKVQLKALKKLGRTMPGDTFEKGRTDANILIALGVAEAVDDESQGDDETQGADGTRPRRRRASRYKRRDLRAEE